MEERTAGPIKGQHNGVSPSGDLEKELPVIDYDLVSLSQIVERVTGQTYTDLVNLAEMCTTWLNEPLENVLTR